MVKNTKKQVKPRPKRFTMVSFMVNYNYEKERLAKLGKTIPAFSDWYNNQVVALQDFCDLQDLGCACKDHTKDFKRSSDHKTFLRDSNGNLIHDDLHYHGVLVMYGRRNATINQWADALEKHGIHISKVSESRKLSNISGISRSDHDAVYGALGYLAHVTPASRKAQKHQYNIDDVELYRMSKFFKVSTSQEARKEYEKLCNRLALIEIDFDENDFWNFYKGQRDEIDSGTTLVELEKEYKQYFGYSYAVYEAKFRPLLERARQNYLQQLSTQFTYFDRKFSYIHIFGVGGTGKSLLADSLAGLLAGDDMRIHVAATPDKRKTPDLLSTYTDELVSVAHELKPGTFSVEGFESFMDPHIYPTVNSRNKDKAYFANNFINANAQRPEDWLYQLFYWSMLVGNGAEVNYQYNAYYGNDIMYFPKSWQSLAKQPEEFFGKHWTTAGQHAFLNEWWQVIRRLSYIVELTPLGENAVRADVYKLDSTKPEALVNANLLDIGGREFLHEFALGTHFVQIGSYSCANIINIKLRGQLAVDIYTKLVSTGLYSPEKLPTLMGANELKEATGLVKPKLHIVEEKNKQEKN